MIGVQPNLRQDLTTYSCHVFDLPGMCPVSGNPQPGSRLFVRYTAGAWFLEVETLAQYIASYIGGKQIGRNLIRDMEQTIQQIASDCRDSVGVTVRVLADLYIADDPSDRSIVRRYPVAVVARKGA